MSDLVMNGKSKTSGGTFEQVEIDGLSTVKGDLTCDALEADGICDFEGNVSVKGKAEFDGICKIYGNLEAEDLDVDGVLEVSGGVTAENAKLNGAFSIGGTLNAGSLDVKFSGSPKAKEVVGGRIHIRRERGARYFRAELVEGDEIRLERSKVKLVRGDGVAIGEGCTAERVEYRSELSVHPKAKVKEQVKPD